MPPRNARALGSKRCYHWDPERFWSVTTIISGGVPKPAIAPWTGKMVAEGAVTAFEKGSLALLVEQDRDAAVEFLKKLPYTQTNRAADIGTRVHEAIEALVKGTPAPPLAEDEKPRMAHFEQFLADYRPKFIASEMSVYNRRHGYAGTLDGIALFGDRALMVDVKTGKGVYPEVGLQLSAYRNAEFIGMPDGTEEPMIETVGGVVLHLTDDGYRLLEVNTGDEVFAAFIYAREVQRWMNETSKRVIGESLPIPEQVTA